jgi:Tfp pilus assembly protein PilN
MSRASSRVRRLLVLLVCLAVAAPLAAAQGAATYQKESEAEYAQQLAAGQIASATINKRLRTIRVTLKDGRRVLAKYPPRQEPRVRAELQAKGVHVSVLGKAQAVAEEKKVPKKHKLRYIIGGVLVAIVVVVGGVLLYNRARTRD